MRTSLLETRIAINQIALVVIGTGLAVAFSAGAFALGQWGWLVAPPMDIAGIALVLIGGRRRRQTQGRRGTALSIVGGLLIVGSIWAAFMTASAID
ncbi:hypothetical protein N802_01840 [Knoellia sinensis KCTC 19936]|uniref:Uncharacterized protein n=1 Tax=Knoellia sinensis KCTC 19936 TaxID=1385520 RepID=A0A0A0JE45_9MICO|nr:hypothetical protein [Knoellia sinensis]KGN35034.1 hypothetical protein N802_01840 [Knoellia sinensis KCTC 19936]